MRIAYLGLGIMGTGMVKNLLAAKHSVSVWNRSQDKCQTAAEAGAEISHSPAEAASNSEVCCICVTNGSAVKDICFGESGISSASELPKAVIDFSTIAPSEAKEIATKFSELGVAFLDAPVSGGDIGAENGTLSIMVGGSEESFNDLTEVFSTVGS